MEEGIKQLEGDINSLKEVFYFHYPNYIKNNPYMKNFIPNFEEVLEYAKRNEYIEEKNNKFIITKKGDDFLKEQREIAYKEEQNYILKNQLEITKNQTKFNKILVVATCILALSVIYEIIFEKIIINSYNLKILLILGFISVFALLVGSLVKGLGDIT